jgi:probable rRNA maturation factor
MKELSAAPSVEVTVSCDAWFDDCPHAAAIAAGAAQAALRDSGGAAQLLVDVTLADDAEQRRLNRIYRGKDVPTNVLAFPQGAPASSRSDQPVLLGDVVLAFETVHQEAAEQNKPFANHLRHLVVHGVLHLLGFDHENAAAAAAMEAREIKILAGLGVPDPYRGIM